MAEGEIPRYRVAGSIGRVMRIIQRVDTGCRIAISSNARRGHPDFLGPGALAFFATLHPRIPHIQCSAMQTRDAGYFLPDHQNQAAEAGIENLHRRSGLVFLNRWAAVHKTRKSSGPQTLAIPACQN